MLGNDTDANMQPLTVAIASVTGPSNGSLTLNANGSFTYTPNANFNGTDSFTYRANDGLANSNLAHRHDHRQPGQRRTRRGQRRPRVAEDAGDHDRRAAPTTPTSTATADVAAVTEPAQRHGRAELDGCFTYTPAANY